MARVSEPSWKWRRIATFAVALACFGVIFRLIDGLDSELNRLLAYGAYFLTGAVVLGYLGLATAQDVVAIWKTGRGMPYDEAPPQ